MLRVFLSGPPAAERADAWVRYAEDGHPVAHGRDVASRWPADAGVEVILAADQVRLAALALPPMPRNRLRQAARYALEDQMATAADESAVAVAQPQPGKTVVAAIASEALIRAIAAQVRRATRIVPESALAPCADAGWTWCASAAGGGFVRRADGSAFAVGSGNDGELPEELRAALVQAKRVGIAPAAVHAALETDAVRLAHWSQAAGVRFVGAPAWHWERAPGGMFAAAPDFLARDSQASAADGTSAARRFRPALILAALALAIHVGALLVQWAWLSVVDWRLSRALVQQAVAAGLPNATTPSAAATGIARRNAELRHLASKRAPADAVPLLARAAPALAQLPNGALKSASYADDAWTLEFATLDAEALSHVSRALGQAGIAAVSAPTAGGTRMRVTLDATAR
jgi:type II secretion system protein L